MSRTPHIHKFKVQKTPLGMLRVCECGERVTELPSPFSAVSPLDLPSPRTKRLYKIKGTSEETKNFHRGKSLL